MTAANNTDGHLTGQLLVAMPTMGDPRFARSVIFMCAHSPEGAMGLVINHLAENLRFADVAEQLSIDPREDVGAFPVYVGGPVETGRGFVLHSSDYRSEGTLEIDAEFSLTATLEVLREIAGGDGPKRCVLTLGYAGWSAGQLDQEIQHNGWLVVPADRELVFGSDADSKWDRALAKIGVDPSLLSGVAGHA